MLRQCLVFPTLCSEATTVLDWLINCVFIADIFVRMRTSVEVGGDNVVDPKVR